MEAGSHCPACAAGGEQERGATVRVRRRRRRSVDSRPSKKRRRGSRKGAKAVFLFSIVWIVLLVGLAIASRWIWPEGEIHQAEDEKREWATLSDDQLLIQARLNECGERLNSFLNETSPEGRAQYVLRSTVTVPRMLRHLQNSSQFHAEGSLEVLARDVIHTPAGPAIETMWRAGADQRVEAIFFEEGGQWKLDWDEFVRYSEEPWALFVAGSGPDEAVFRVFARQRIYTGIAGGEGPFGIILAGPVVGQPSMSIASTPEIRIPDHPEIVARLLEAFDLRAKGLGAFGSKTVAADPADMIRVRVRVSRHRDDNGDRFFKIEELLATHWLELPDKTGEKAEEKAQGN